MFPSAVLTIVHAPSHITTSLYQLLHHTCSAHSLSSHHLLQSVKFLKVQYRFISSFGLLLASLAPVITTLADPCLDPNCKLPDSYFRHIHYIFQQLDYSVGVTHFLQRQNSVSHSFNFRIILDSTGYTNRFFRPPFTTVPKSMQEISIQQERQKVFLTVNTKIQTLLETWSKLTSRLT